jgi:nucleoside-diphosphate-sugar epimerase
MVATTAISPADGPVAVTGASGFIGSWVCEDLVAKLDQIVLKVV